MIWTRSNILLRCWEIWKFGQHRIHLEFSFFGRWRAQKNLLQPTGILIPFLLCREVPQKRAWALLTALEIHGFLRVTPASTHLLHELWFVLLGWFPVRLAHFPVAIHFKCSFSAVYVFHVVGVLLASKIIWFRLARLVGWREIEPREEAIAHVDATRYHHFRLCIGLGDLGYGQLLLRTFL